MNTRPPRPERRMLRQNPANLERLDGVCSCPFQFCPLKRYGKGPQMTKVKIGRAGLVTEANLAILLDCPVDHVADIAAGRVKPTPRESAIITLCNTAREAVLERAMSPLTENEWRVIPGYSKYEASVSGTVRRARYGHGSQAGKVLKPKVAKWGHLYVNLSNDEGEIKTVGVHVAVCLAFHGPQPSPAHIACHDNDIVTDNTPGNVYWGTHSKNALDRERNKRAEASGARRAHWPNIYGPPTLSQLKRWTHAKMAAATSAA